MIFWDKHCPMLSPSPATFGPTLNTTFHIEMLFFGLFKNYSILSTNLNFWIFDEKIIEFSKVFII